MEIRYTVEGDWAALRAIRLASLQDAPRAFGLSYASAAAYPESRWRDQAAGRARPRFLLAFEGERPVGMIGHAASAGPDLELIGMWVAPEYRGQRVATLLVDAVKLHARSAGHPRVLLAVSPDNGRAAAFYQKQGFAFLPEWEPLDSDPSVTLQSMQWLATTEHTA
ncbi:MAG TPA: GNAT family N-acetyltransferase [Burkholderiaceae bacterium]